LARYCKAFILVGELAYRRGARNIRARPGCHKVEVDDEWTVHVNAHAESAEMEAGLTVPPLSMFVEYNGWPAGLIDSGGGIVAAGTSANEDKLCAALEAAIGREKGDAPADE
jgi:hypothetical protein